MAEGRSRRQEARRGARPGGEDRAAQAAHHPRHGDRHGAGQRRLRHGRRRRCRHPQPDRLHAAGSGSLVLRPAHARHRAARPLRPADRRLARRRRASCAPAATAAALPRRATRRPKSWSPSSPARSSSTPTARRRVDFDIPQFNGTVRIMAVAWTKEAVGHAHDGRDRARSGRRHRRPCRASWRPATRPSCGSTSPTPTRPTATIRCRSTRPTNCRSDAVPEKVTLTAGKRQTLTVPLKGEIAGDGGVTIRLANAAGLTIEQNLALPVRPATLPVTTRMVVDLGPNGSSLRIDRELLAASILPGAYVSIGVSPSAAFDVPVAAAGARPLPLWLRRADDEPRAAAALCQRSLGRVRHGGRSGPQGPRPGRDLPRPQQPVLVGQLRPVGSGLRRSVARRLCHRLPDPGARAELRRAGRGHDAGAEQPAERAVLRHRPAGPRHRDRLCALRSGPQQEGLGRRPALLCRHAARGLHQPAGGGPARRQPRALWRRGAVGSDLHGGAPACEGDVGIRLLALRLRLAAARHAPPCCRSPPRAGRCRRSCRS